MNTPLTNETFDQRFGRLAGGLGRPSALTLDAFPFFRELQRLWPGAQSAGVGYYIANEIEKFVNKLGLDRVSVFSRMFVSSASSDPLTALDRVLQSAQWKVTMLQGWDREKKYAISGRAHVPCDIKQLFQFMANCPFFVLAVELSSLNASTDDEVPEPVTRASDTKHHDAVVPQSSSLPAESSSSSSANISASTSADAQRLPAKKEYVSFKLVETEGKPNEFCIKPLNDTFLKLVREFFGLRKDLKVNDVVVLHDCPWHVKDRQFTLCRVLGLPSQENEFCYRFLKLNSDIGTPKLVCRAPCPSVAENKATETDKSLYNFLETADDDQLIRLIQCLSTIEDEKVSDSIARQLRDAIDTMTGALGRSTRPFDTKPLIATGVSLFAIAVYVLTVAVVRRRQQAARAAADSETPSPSSSPYV